MKKRNLKIQKDNQAPRGKPIRYESENYISFEKSLRRIKPSGGINKNRLALQAETENLYLFFLNLHK